MFVPLPSRCLARRGSVLFGRNQRSPVRRTSSPDFARNQFASPRGIRPAFKEKKKVVGLEISCPPSSSPYLVLLLPKDPSLAFPSSTLELRVKVGISILQDRNSQKMAANEQGPPKCSFFQEGSVSQLESLAMDQSDEQVALHRSRILRKLDMRLVPLVS
jgi:hypothetical protein